MRFLAYPTIAAWSALFYIVISSIGITYSGAFYFRFDDIHIFDFFTTPDFLLSAFRDIKTLIIGVSATLFGIGILIYRVYNSDIYSAYKFNRDIYRREQESRIKWEAALLLSITLLFIFLTFCLWWASSYFQWPPVSSIIKGPHITSLLIFALFALITSFLIFALFAPFFIRLFRAHIIKIIAPFFIRLFRAHIILLFITVLFIFLIGIFLVSWKWPEHLISMVLLHLVSILILIPILLAFGRLFCRLLGEEQEYQIKWGGRFFALILLVEGIVILPFLSGVDDSKAALEKESRPVKVELRRGASEAGILPPDRTLLLGTTSSFHIFYECENALKNGNAPKCGEGHPFIIPTANIASLEFVSARKPSGGIAQAVKGLGLIISGLKSEKIKVTKAISHLNEIITSINMSSGAHAKFITQQIESPKSKVVANLGPDKIATVAIALKSYLEGNIPVTHLNETITTLNATIKTLNQADVLDPDLANIAGAIKSLNPLKIETPDLKGIPDAIKSLDPLEVNTPDLKEISEAIKEHTTEISDAIRGLNISCPGVPNPVQPHCPRGWKKATTIWPFPKEEHELKPNSDGQKQLDALFIEMEQKFVESTLGQLILVGRSDAKPVCKQTLALYGSSNGLAQGRAKWIWDELAKKFTTPEQQKGLQDRTLLLSAGPLHVRGEASEMNRAKDRSVEVYACWTPKESEQAGTSAEPAE